MTLAHMDDIERNLRQEISQLKSAVSEQRVRVKELEQRMGDRAKTPDPKARELQAADTHADAERVRGAVREAVLAEQAAAPGTDVWYPQEFATSIANRVAAKLAPPRFALPSRKEWDADRHDRDDTSEAGDYESSDYVDGWNEALEAIEALASAPVLSAEGAHELGDRRTVDGIRKEPHEELAQRRTADLCAEDRATLLCIKAQMEGRLYPHERALLDRLLRGDQ